MILEIKLRSRNQGDAALDNVARFLKRTENGWSLDRGQSGNLRVQRGDAQQTPKGPVMTLENREPGNDGF